MHGYELPSHTCIGISHPVCDGIPEELPVHLCPPSPPEHLCMYGVSYHGTYTPCERFGFRLHLYAVDERIDVLREATDIAGNHRFLRTPCFQQHKAERLVPAGDNDKIAGIQETDVLRVRNIPDKIDRKIPGPLLEILPHPAVPGHDHFCIPAVPAYLP